MTRRLPRFALAALAAATLLAACGADDGGGPEATERPAPEAVAQDASSSPGTELGEGFTVAPGAALIAAPVPLGTTAVIGGVSQRDPGWRAHLFVDGEPSAVFQSYLDQATEAGYRINPTAEGAPFTSEGDANPPTGYRLCGAVGRAYECSANAAGEEGECLVLGLRRSSQVSHMTVELRLASPFGCDMPSGVPTSEVADAPTLPEEWPALPDEGEAIGDDWGTISPIRVQPGSELAAAPVWGSGCREPIAVLRVSDNADHVLDAYLSEIARVTGFDPIVSSEEVEGDPQLVRRIAQVAAGGPRFELDVVTDDGRSWLFLTGCEG